MNAYLYQFILAAPILGLQILLALIIILLISGRSWALLRHLKKYGMHYMLLLALAGMIGSLGFSLGYHYPPCDLCWYQRIFQYPQVFLFAVALRTKDSMVWVYSLVLSVIGFIIAGYQVLIQFNPKLAESSVCSIVPAAESCSDILIQVFGYISIPVMSLTVFTTMIVLFIIQKNKKV